VGQAAPAVRNGTGRILVMDDEEAIRAMLQSGLTQLGYEVQCASDGAEALKLFVKAKTEGCEFACVLLDLTVPGGMGGKETAAEIRRIDSSAKIIVSSGYADAPIMAAFREFGFDDLIPKPYTLAELSVLLTRIIGVDQTTATALDSAGGAGPKAECYRLTIPLPAVWDKSRGERLSVTLPIGAVLRISSQRTTTLTGMIGVYCEGRHYSVYATELIQKSERVWTASRDE